MDVTCKNIKANMTNRMDKAYGIVKNYQEYRSQEVKF